MSKHKRYLIIAENKDVGYVIGYVGNYKRAKSIVDKLAFHLNNAGEVLPDGNTKYVTFKIHPSARQFQPQFRTCCSNGVFATYIFDTRIPENFSLRRFIFERSSTIYAYDLENYDTDTTTFVKETLHFIAN